MDLNINLIIQLLDTGKEKPQHDLSFLFSLSFCVSPCSGQTSSLTLVNFGSPPKSKVERAAIINQIYAHSRSAPSGDKSLEAAALASHEITNEPADDYLVFLFSDANLGRYGISPAAISTALKGDGRSQGYCILIAEPNAASWIVEELPFGRGFVVLDVEKLPQTFKEIFSHATLEDSK